MKISISIPEIYWLLHKEFGVKWEDGLVITYGDTVYCKYPISEDLKVHEATHIEQQAKMGVELWWKTYITDVKFRLEQETAAYINQARYIKENFSRHDRRKHFNHMADSMVRMYGGMCTKEQAMDILKSA